jgi:hypothetical protein
MGEGLPALVMVHVKNSTEEPADPTGGTVQTDPPPPRVRKDYVLAVHPQLCPIFEGGFGKAQKLTCHNAVASTFGLRGDQYRPEAET